MESPDAATPVAMYPSPALNPFVNLGTPGVAVYCLFRTTFGSTERLFAVASYLIASIETLFLFEVFSNGTAVSRGTIASDPPHPVIITMDVNAGGTGNLGQLYVGAGTVNAVLDLNTNAFTASLAYGPGGGGYTVQQAGFIDGYIIANTGPGSRGVFGWSALNDATSWPGGSVARISVSADNKPAMLVDHREVWFFGDRRTVVYYNSGDLLNPFQPIPGAFIEQGIAAAQSPVRLDNSVFWLGQDERGRAIAWRANGYQPVRVSNHAIEFQWDEYPTITDAIGYAFQMHGHSFWQLTFPTADNTWVYDASINQWHERSWLNNGVDHAHRSQCFCYCFNQMFVGDTQSATIYTMDEHYLNDIVMDANAVSTTSPVHRVRRAPHIAVQQEWVNHHQLQVYLEAGIAPAGVSPQISLRWSDDGGHTWSNYYAVSAGQQGQYRTRAMWRRLGRSRDRIYEISCTDPIPWRIIDAYLFAEPGYMPTGRLMDQLRKSA